MEILEGRYLSMGPVEIDQEEAGRIRANRTANCVKCSATIPSRAIVRDEAVSVVGFGPSLKETVARIPRDVPIITVSKAHDYLLARGITPTWHVDVDYRPHKALFIAEFNPAVEYVLASHVSPAYVERALGADLRLFHSLVPQGGPYEPGFTKVSAMFDAGLQAALIAYTWGYRKQRWFGIDASFAGAEMHAGPHEGVLGQADRHVVKVGDRVYETNGLLVRQALWAERMLRQYAHFDVTIEGDGMIRPFLQERGRVSVQ